MSARRALMVVFAALAAAPAHAGIIFTPHLGEYSRLPAGQYTEGTFIYTEIDHVYDRDGDKVTTGSPFIPGGDSVDASLLLVKYLWIGNVFRDTHVPVLNTHPQFCRIIGGAGWQQGTGNVVNRDRMAGMKSGANGLTDLFGLCGIYGDQHISGPLAWNGLFGTTVKAPLGEYDQKSLLNVGTHYWTVIPQVAWHGELFGRLIHDGTVAYQKNFDNDQPSFGGLTPTQPADVYNLEGNLAWKWTEHWYTDFGISYRKSRGPNEYDKYTLNLKQQPLNAQTACDNTNNGVSPILGQPVVDPAVCLSTNDFYLNPRPGPYFDRGTQGTLLTAGMYYIYRTSSVVQLRMAKPIKGRGGQIDTIYDVCAASPQVTKPSECNASTNLGPNGGTLVSTQNAVQEASAVSASPYLEIRFVYLFWAP